MHETIHNTTQIGKATLVLMSLLCYRLTQTNSQSFLIKVYLFRNFAAYKILTVYIYSTISTKPIPQLADLNS